MRLEDLGKEVRKKVSYRKSAERLLAASGYIAHKGVWAPGPGSGAVTVEKARKAKTAPSPSRLRRPKGCAEDKKTRREVILAQGKANKPGGAPGPYRKRRPCK